MALYFPDDENLTFGVQSSNIAEVAQFSSTGREAFLHLYTNNYLNYDNVVSGVVIGTSNYSSTSARNDFYMGHVDTNNNVTRVLTIKDERVGIRTSSPAANVHIVPNAIGREDTLRVDGLLAPAIVVNSDGYVGIGTTPSSNQLVTIRGKLVVDTFSVGNIEQSGSGSLIVAYGLKNPSTVSNLDFGYSVMSNIQSIITPFVYAENIDTTFQNISRQNFVYDIAVTPSVPQAFNTGQVTFQVQIYGNATSYQYRLFAKNNANNTSIQIGTYLTPTATTSTTYNFGVGSYMIGAEVVGISPNNVYGRPFVNSNVATISLNIVDSIGTPSVSVASYGTSNTQYAFVSGVRYFSDGTIFTFPVGGLSFSNIVGSINPAPYIPKFFFLTSNIQSDGVGFSYTDVFAGSTTTSNASSLSYPFSPRASNSIVTIFSRVVNLNASNITSTPISVSYVNSNYSESNMQIGVLANVPIYTVRRRSIVSLGLFPNGDPTTADFVSTSINALDAIYNPISNTFVDSYTSLNRTSADPSYTVVTGSHDYVFLDVATIVPLPSFVLTFPRDAVIKSVYIKYIMTGSPGWLNATVYFGDGGCAAYVPIDGNRFSVRLSPEYVLDSAVNIQLVIRFSGSISNNDIRFSYE